MHPISKGGSSPPYFVHYPLSITAAFSADVRQREKLHVQAVNLIGPLCFGGNRHDTSTAFGKFADNAPVIFPGNANGQPCNVAPLGAFVFKRIDAIWICKSWAIIRFTGDIAFPIFKERSVCLKFPFSFSK